MDTIALELRDKGTFIPIVCFELHNEAGLTCEEDYLLSRAGYGDHTLIAMTRLDLQGPIHYTPEAWGDRTMQVAHRWITDNWDEIGNADVIDVEFILGETDKPKPSENEEHSVRFEEHEEEDSDDDDDNGDEDEDEDDVATSKGVPNYSLPGDANCALS